MEFAHVFQCIHLYTAYLSSKSVKSLIKLGTKLKVWKNKQEQPDRGCAKN